jgi:hypothetical protein
MFSEFLFLLALFWNSQKMVIIPILACIIATAIGLTSGIIAIIAIEIQALNRIDVNASDYEFYF